MPASIVLRKARAARLGDQWNRTGGGEPTLGDARWCGELAAGSSSDTKGGWTDPVAPLAGLCQWTGSARDRLGQLSHLGDDPHAKQSREPPAGGQPTLATGWPASGGNLSGIGLSGDLHWLALGWSNRGVATATLEDTRPGGPMAGVTAPWRNQSSPALVRLTPARLADQRGGVAAHLPCVPASQLNITQDFATNASTSSTRMRRMMISSSIWLCDTCTRSVNIW